MTGAFVKIRRYNEWQNIEFEKLTDDELDEFARLHPDDGWMWAKFIAKFIRDFD